MSEAFGECISGIYKVIGARIDKTPNGHVIFKITIEGGVTMTKLMPASKTRKSQCLLYGVFKESGHSNLDAIIGKYARIYANKNNYGYSLDGISNLDVLSTFNSCLSSYEGRTFYTELPIWFFLKRIGRNIEEDGSIKLQTNFGDVRVKEASGGGVCYSQKESCKYLTFENIDAIFNQFYKDIKLSPYNDDQETLPSYYDIDFKSCGIVVMNNHVKTSYRMTTSGDYNKWIASPVLKISDSLTLEQELFLKSQLK
ncbi:hypothetical protein ACF1CY_002666 [Providencia rettgeri]